MGADKVEDALRPLLRAVPDAGHPVVWACDPMHGNTFTAGNGRKTRHFEDILARDRRLRAGPPGRGDVAGRRPRRADRRRRHRVPRRRRRPRRTATSTTATRRCATHGSTAASASTSPSASPNSSATSPDRTTGHGDGARPHQRLAGPPRLRRGHPWCRRRRNGRRSRSRAASRIDLQADDCLGDTRRRRGGHRHPRPTRRPAGMHDRTSAVPRRRLPVQRRTSPIARPDTTRIYSNAGIELVADAVATAADMSFGDYLDAALFEPLGMTSSDLRGSPAYSVWSNLTDMIRFVGEVMRPTAHRHVDGG